jgi:hypothetical protein
MICAAGRPIDHQLLRNGHRPKGAAATHWSEATLSPPLKLGY